MQHVQLVQEAVVCRDAPLDEKKNSISRSAEAGESEACTAFFILSVNKTKFVTYHVLYACANTTNG